MGTPIAAKGRILKLAYGLGTSGRIVGYSTVLYFVCVYDLITR